MGAQQAGRTEVAEDGPEIELFHYPEAAWSGAGVSEEELERRFAEVFSPGHLARRGSGSGGPGMRGPDMRSPDMRSPDMRSANGAPEAAPVLGAEEIAGLIAAESRVAEERGHSDGMEAGIARGREEAARQLQSERDRLHAQAAALIASSVEARDACLHQLEQEAVRLALAIAARILRREAQMDPLLLTGAVRVALGQLAESTVVLLRVPEQDAAMWEEALAHMPGLVLRPQVIGEPQMALGDCRMETEIGSAQLGLWAQLQEIERGFFDRVGASGRAGRMEVETEIADGVRDGEAGA